MTNSRPAPTPLPAPTAPPAACPPRAAHLAPPRRAKPPRHLADLTPPSARDAVAALGEKPFRAKQLSTHYFERLVDDPAADDRPARGRPRASSSPTLLPDAADPGAHASTADDGTTVKTLWRLFDGALVESVLMRYPDRVTMCVSSQAGCGMNCPFCATGQAGLTRNMSTAEIVEQVVAGGPGAAPRRGRRAAAPAPRLRQQRRLHGHGRAAGQLQGRRSAPSAGSPTRRPTGSACPRAASPCRRSAWCPAIDQLADEGIPVTLALSLHAPDDELRDELVPINTRWKVAEALDAACALRRHDRAPGLHRVRPDPRHQRPGLARRPARRRARPRAARGWVHVNLIPLNPTPGLEVDRLATAATSASSSSGCGRTGIPATVRDTRGREIDGACGQLAAHDLTGADQPIARDRRTRGEAIVEGAGRAQSAP